jgi:hypothetical protein
MHEDFEGIRKLVGEIKIFKDKKIAKKDEDREDLIDEI